MRRNTFDPVTPLSNAISANQRLGNNARLIKQIGGWGHCTGSHPSLCTARATRAYFLEGTLPAEKQSACGVDRGPFDPVDGLALGGLNEEEADLAEAWRQWSESWEWRI